MHMIKHQVKIIHKDIIIAISKARASSPVATSVSGLSLVILVLCHSFALFVYSLWTDVLQINCLHMK